MRMDGKTACISFRYVISNPKILKNIRHFNSLRLTLVALYLETYLNHDNHLLIFDRKVMRMYQNTQIILSSK